MEYRWILSDFVDSELLTIDPKGWDGMQFELARDTDFHGVFNNYTLDLEFLCKSGGGYDFINDRYEQFGTNINIGLTVEIRCTSSDAFETLFTGLLNMNTIDRTDFRLGCSVENLDLRRIVLGRGDVPIDLSATTAIDGDVLSNYTYGGYDLNMHSRTIELSSEIGYTQAVSESDTQTLGPTPITYTAYIQHGFDLLKGDLGRTQPNPAIIDIQTSGFTFASATAFPFYEAFDPVVVYPATFTLDYDFVGTLVDSSAPNVSRTLFGNWDLMLYYGSSQNNVKAITLGSIAGYTAAVSPTNKAFNISDTTTIDLNYGDKIWLAWFTIGGIGYRNNAGFNIDVTWDWQYTTANLSLNIESDSAEEQVESWAIHELYSRVCESITGNVSGAFYSEYFGRTNSEPVAYGSNGCASFLAVTNGLKLRQQDKPINVSLNELYAATNAMYNIGLGFEVIDDAPVVRVENKEYFYDSSTVILTCSNIKEVVMTIAQELYYNEAEIGYSDWEPEEINGLEETNTSHKYVLGDVTLKNKYNAVSPYLTGGYAIEVTRRTKQVTKDTQYDNNNFVIALSRSVDGGGNPDELDTPETDTNVTSSSGVPFIGTVYNIEHTPAKMLLRHMNVLSGCISKFAGSEVRFQSGEGNIEAEIQISSIGCPGDYSGTNLAENANLDWDDTDIRDGEPLWIPEVYTFDYPLSISDYIAIKDNPYGVIRFSRTETDYKNGFILGINYDPNRQLASFRLLRSYN